MNKEEVLESLKRIIKPYLEEESEINTLDEDSKLKDGLNFDSADLVEIVLDIEEEFDIEIEDEKIEKIETIQDVLDIIESKT